MNFKGMSRYKIVVNNKPVKCIKRFDQDICVERVFRSKLRVKRPVLDKARCL